MAKGIVLRIGTEYKDADIKRAMADLAKLQAGASGPQMAMQRFGQSLQDAGRKIGSFGRSMTAAVTVPLVAAGAGAFAMIQKASDLQESISKVGVVFGDSAAQINDWSKTSATALGQSTRQALDAASTFAVFGKSAGLSGGELVTFSTDLTQLAADMASFSNTTPQEAVDALGAALRGESEPIRRFGVLLDDATLRAEALSLGISDGLTPLSQQQRVLAAQSAIFKQTTDAQGDFARTSDGLANQQRILKAELENVGTELGTALLPVAQTVVALIRDEFVPFVQNLVDRFKALSPEAQNTALAVGAIAAAIGPALMLLGPMVSGFGSLLSFMGPLVGALTGSAGGFGALAGGIAAASGPIAIVIAAVAGLVAIFVAMWRESEVFRTAIVNAFNAVKDAIMTAVDTIKQKIQENQDAIDVLKGFFQMLGDIIGNYVVPAIQFLFVQAIENAATVIGYLIDGVSAAITFIRDFGVQSYRVAANVVDAFGGMVDTVLGKLLEMLQGAERSFGWVPVVGDALRGAIANFETFRAEAIIATDAVSTKLREMADNIDAATAPRNIEITASLDATAAWAAGMMPGTTTLTQPTTPSGVAVAVASTGAPKLTPWEQFVKDMQEGVKRAKSRARLISAGVPEQLADAIVGREGFQRITRRLLEGGREAIRRFVNMWQMSPEGQAAMKPAATPQLTPWEQIVKDMQEGVKRAKSRASLISAGVPEQLADAIVGREGFQRITQRLLEGGREAIRRFVNLWIGSAEGQASIKSAVDALVEKAQRGIDKLKQKTSDFLSVQREYAQIARDFGKVGTLAGDVPLTAANISQNLADRLATVREFSGAIKQLQEKGLGGSALLDIIRLGPFEGLQYAKAILEGGQYYIDTISRLSAAFGGPASDIGRIAAETVTGSTLADLQAGQRFTLQAGAVQITVNGEVTAQTRAQITQAVTDAFLQVGREARTRGRTGVR